ncbi:MAG: acyl-CoA dehydrogenase family protein [Gammaproteobacteria bacterium]
MNLDFSDEQKFLQEEANKFFLKEDTLKRTRAIMESDEPFDKELWRKVIELGWTAIRIPENFNGLGLSHLELCVIAEEIGKSLAPIPFSSSVYMFTEALIESKNDRLKESLLPGLADGSIVGTFAAAESLTPLSAENLKTTVTNNKINGTKIAVPDVEAATHVMVVCKNANDVELRSVALNEKGLKVTLQANIDPSKSFYQIDFNDVSSELISQNGWDTWEHLLNQAAVLVAFEQVGGAQASLDMAKKYAMERYAFGRAIGSYQAIKHKLADMYISLTLAKSNCYYGAWALSSGSPELGLAAATARVAATKAFQLCAKENIQTHGGNGFTWEYDCHLFYKRSKVLSLNLGSEAAWKEKLVTNLDKSNSIGSNQ